MRVWDSAAQGAAVHGAFATWAEAAVDRLRRATAAVPDALSSRHADGWEPLLAIADDAGGEWPDRARGAAVALSTGAEAEDDSRPGRLLTDIRDTWPAATRGLRTSEILAARGAIDRRSRGGLDERGLARELRVFGIRPGTRRFGGITAKRYARAGLEPLWETYATHTF